MKNQKGFALFEMLVALILISGLGFSIWYVRGKQEAKNSPQSSATNKADSPRAENKTGSKSYSNDIIGLKFSYPVRWGTPVLKTKNDEDRFVPASGYTEFDITFKNAPLFILPIINNKNNYLVQYDGCFNNAGFLGFFKTSKPGKWQQSETAPGNHYTTYSKVLTSNDETTIFEEFAISTIVSPQGYCNGLSVYGSKKVRTNSKRLNEVEFLWSETAATFGENQPKLDLNDLANFKKNPEQYISKENLYDIQKTVESIQSY